MTPEGKSVDGERMLGLGSFISHSVRTTIHVKLWWKLKRRFLSEGDPSAAGSARGAGRTRDRQRGSDDSARGSRFAARLGAEHGLHDGCRASALENQSGTKRTGRRVSEIPPVSRFDGRCSVAAVRLRAAEQPDWHDSRVGVIDHRRFAARKL